MGIFFFLSIKNTFLHLTLQSKKIKLDLKSLIKGFKFHRKCVKSRQGKEPWGSVHKLCGLLFSELNSQEIKSSLKRQLTAAEEIL